MGGEAGQSFEISPDDEVEFLPNVSEEEDRRIGAEIAGETRYTPLDRSGDKTEEVGSSLLGRVKAARQRAIREAVERDMTEEERLQEQLAASQTLSKVFSIMKDNSEVFGETSFEDVKAQMELYNT